MSFLLSYFKLVCKDGAKGSYIVPVHTRFQVLSPNSLEVNMCNLTHREHGSWDLPIHMISQVQVPSMTWVSTWQHFWRWGLEFVLWVGLSKKLNPIRTHKFEIFCTINQDLTLIIFWGSKVGTLPPCWDSLTWVGLGTWDPMWTSL